jgi:selenide,water dikinase
LHTSPAISHPDLVVGLGVPDDAGVFRAPSGDLLVQTVDFFTPVVDDPFDWGRVTAANALSDIYAMGAEPLTALQLVGWPRDTLPFEAAARVVEGGLAVMAEAGCTVVGGHSIDAPEPQYGFAVTGIASPDRLLTSAGGRAGDLLVLTKPLGIGIATTAVKRGVAPPGLEAAAIALMVTLNRAAAAGAHEAGATAATDVTGFGLVGHLHELAEASGVAAEIDAAAVRVLDGVTELARAGVVPGGSARNREAALAYADLGTDTVTATILTDAQTSGGLLVSVQPGSEAPLLGIGGVVVGRLVAGEPGRVVVR